jgi:hypothetical protein
MARGFSEFGHGSGETGAFSGGRSERRAAEPTFRSIHEHQQSRTPVPRPREVGPDGTAWIRSSNRDRVVVPIRRADVARRKRDLNTRITFVCEAAAKKSGRSAAYHAGVPESTFRSWQHDRNFLYWSSDAVGKAIQERMALDGYRPEGPRNKDLGPALADAAELGLELYRAAALAQGIVPRC